MHLVDQGWNTATLSEMPTSKAVSAPVTLHHSMIVLQMLLGACFNLHAVQTCYTLPDVVQQTPQNGAGLYEAGKILASSAVTMMPTLLLHVTHALQHPGRCCQ